jgi:dihydrolipoamide dehydrogenase
MSESYDVVIIGGGPGGYVAAIRSAQNGLKTAIIEKRKFLGGTCLNVGCIPSKALLHSTEQYAFAKNHAEEHGIHFSNLSYDFSKMMSRKENVIGSLAGGIDGLIAKNKITRYFGHGKIISPTEIEITPEKKTEKSEKISAKHIILATGSEPIQLPFLPFDEKQVVSSTGALSLSQVPKKMIVVGGGVIGVELASVYNRLGSDVTIVEMLDQICFGMDQTVCKEMLRILKKQGLKFLLSTQVKEAKKDKNGVTLTLSSGESIQGDVVLVAVGRKPYSEGVGLENVGVARDKRGRVYVDGQFRTTIVNIFAIGDLIDGPMLAHKASEEGVAVADIIAGKSGHVNYMAIPNVIYTHPEAAGVGLTEQQAIEMGLEIRIGNFSMKGNSRARAMGSDDGLVKVIEERSSGRLIGMHIVSVGAGELIAEGMLAIEKRATIDDIGLAPQAHPTLSEAIKEAALDVTRMAIHK